MKFKKNDWVEVRSSPEDFSKGVNYYCGTIIDTPKPYSDGYMVELDNTGQRLVYTEKEIRLVELV